MPEYPKTYTNTLIVLSLHPSACSIPAEQFILRCAHLNTLKVSTKLKFFNRSKQHFASFQHTSFNLTIALPSLILTSSSMDKVRIKIRLRPFGNSLFVGGKGAVFSAQASSLAYSVFQMYIPSEYLLVVRRILGGLPAPCSVCLCSFCDLSSTACYDTCTHKQGG